MNIAGIVKSSFIDYPGCASTVIFLGGCNFKCGYCHNPEIVSCVEGEITLPDFYAFLKKRKRFVDAVCISGGEPTIHSELYDLICQIRDIGYKVKLDTNGTNPQLLRRLTAEGLVDHIAMDIKGPWEKYDQIAGVAEPLGSQGRQKTISAAVAESLAILIEAGKASLSNLAGTPSPASVPEAVMVSEAKGPGHSLTYELRTTICRELLTKEDIVCMASQLAGAELWYLQTFNKQGDLLDVEGSYSAYTPAEMEELRIAAAAMDTVSSVCVR